MTQVKDLVDAYDAFITGCKSDGTWSAIKASCIMAGWDNLDGALTPLVGTAPTNNNFASGDYSRTTGLVGDGSTKYLDSNRLHTIDPQDSFHMSVFASFISSTNSSFMGTDSTGEVGSSYMGGGTSNDFFTRNRSSTGTASVGGPPVVGFLGTNRSASGSYTQRTGNTNYTVSVTSETPYNSNVYVYRRGSGTPFYSLHRLSFYSIGESLDLALLNSRVTTLVSDIAAALP